MVMKKLQDHGDSDGRVITEGKDRSQIYKRQVFGDALKQQVFKDKCQIYCIQASMIDDALFVTRSSDCKIKIWNVKSQNVEKEIIGHKQPVEDFVMLENPLDDGKEKMFAILLISLMDCFSIILYQILQF